MSSSCMSGLLFGWLCIVDSLKSVSTVAVERRTHVPRYQSEPRYIDTSHTTHDQSSRHNSLWYTFRSNNYGSTGNYHFSSSIHINGPRPHVEVPSNHMMSLYYQDFILVKLIMMTISVILLIGVMFLYVSWKSYDPLIGSLDNTHSINWRRHFINWLSNCTMLLSMAWTWSIVQVRMF